MPSSIAVRRVWIVVGMGSVATLPPLLATTLFAAATVACPFLPLVRVWLGLPPF